ncbi:MAG: hypothetical protein JWP97_260 [Labilithrix sp.]|nr:hypothetical protein [Labilithrix sp.]
MRTTLLKRALPLLLSALTLACHEDAKIDPDFSTAAPPRSLEDALLYVSSAPQGGHALTLDVATNDAKVIKHDLPKGPVQTFPMPGTEGRQVLVFTGGLPASSQGDKRVAAVPANVLLFDRTGPLFQLPLSGRYDTLTLSDDGAYAIAYGSNGNLALQNAIEVVNLAKARALDPKAAVVMDLSFDGRAPTNFVFAPSTGFVRRLAIAPLANALQVIDLDHPELGEISIKLSEQASLQPTKIVFAADQFFVQSVNSTQILTFQSIEQPSTQRMFQLAPSILTASANVEDLETVGTGASLRLLALAGDLQVFDPSVGPTASVPGVGAFAQIYKFEGASPVDSTKSPRAALYGPKQSQIGFVDLGDDKAWATRDVELIELGDTLVQFIPIAGTTLALATHPTNRISLIDLEQRTVKRVLLDSSSATTLLEQSAATLRLWVGGSDGSLGNIDLRTLLPHEVPLTFSYAGATVSDGGSSAARTPGPGLSDQQNMLLVPGPAAAPSHRRIAVVESSTSGRVALLDADNPLPETALEVVGFFLAGLFD